ncbi:MAG TPA: hypothetical protein VMT64_04835, partial [Candidatus Binataceae bacterium]|nr:hypothetical protein [Candidatus Binataceae bacterium]
MSECFRVNGLRDGALSPWLMVVARALGALLVAASMSACAFTEHDAELSAPAATGTSEVGRGTKLYFRFVDERDDVVVGHRGVGGNGAKITAPSLPAQVESSLRDGLVKKGFQLVPTEQGCDASVVYRLRS